MVKQRILSDLLVRVPKTPYVVDELELARARQLTDEQLEQEMVHRIRMLAESAGGVVVLEGEEGGTADGAVTTDERSEGDPSRRR